MKRCKNSSTYDAISQPKCGCEVCIAKWQAAQAERIKRANSPEFLKALRKKEDKK